MRGHLFFFLEIKVAILFWGFFLPLNVITALLVGNANITVSVETDRQTVGGSMSVPFWLVIFEH